ncbi:head completion, neck hetero-dimeric protein [Aeromonas phage 65.2]|uniref:Head completion, neck hetero-dimeric protein n=1 Tax=Aeromonas phage 65.2 TaxID=1932896 RepID=A0A219YC06_9CAUD|nr:head completion, neck hetero-dimeric protein [Aeromonas phage 65.2]
MFNENLFARLENGTGYEDDTNKKEILNPHMNNYQYGYSQAFARQLISESIQMKGIEVYYMRREFVKLDLLFGEDMQSKFNKAYRVAMYLDSFEGYEGRQEFFSKFGMSVNDEAQFTISPELFNRQADGDKAREGDLIYFPMNNAIFEVTWVEPNNPFFQMGQETQYKITAQKFIYSGEELKPEFNPSDFVMDSGLDPIRNLDKRVDTSIIEYEEDDFIADEAEDFIDDFDTIIGTGLPIATAPFTPWVEYKPQDPCEDKQKDWGFD